MFIAFNRIGRFKRWIINGVKGFFIGIKNTIVGAVRGPRGGNGNGSGGADIIALEVTDVDGRDLPDGTGQVERIW